MDLIHCAAWGIHIYPLLFGIIQSTQKKLSMQIRVIFSIFED